MVSVPATSTRLHSPPGRRLVLRIVLALSIVGVAAPAEAEQSSEKKAKAAFAAGREQYDAKRYRQAASEFERAYELKPNWKLLYNIGQAYAAAKLYGRAISAFERYLAEGGDDVPIERQEYVIGEARRLKNLVGFLQFEVPAGSTVVIDGEERGTAPLPRALMLTAAVEHHVEVVSNGEEILSRALILTGGEKKEMVARVEESPSPAEPEEEPEETASIAKDAKRPDGAIEPRPEPPDRGLETSDDVPPQIPAGWATLGVGGALLIAATVTGSVALSLENDLEKVCKPDGCPPEKKGDRDRLDALGPTTDVLLGAGAVALVTGTVLLVIGADDESAREETVVTLAPSGAGAVLQGRF